MPAAPTPADELERLAELQSYDILDTTADEAFDGLVRLATKILDVPIGLVSLIDSDRQWFKASIGVDFNQTPRDHAFCAHAILAPQDVLIVEDATCDPRFSDNPNVLDDPGIRFYAGAPIVTSTGRAMGTLCAIDRVPRSLTQEQIDVLRVLSIQAAKLLELRRQTLAVQRSDRFANAVLNTVAEGIVVVDRDDNLLAYNRQAEELLHVSLAPLLGYPISAAYVSQSAEPAAIEGRVEVRLERKDGTSVWFGVSATSFEDPVNGRCRVSSFADITERRRLEETLREQAATDDLTGLTNRRQFRERLEQAIAEATRYGGELTVAALDLDYFKSINDRYGHAGGDSVLRHVASMLRFSLRAEDTVARLGGDEFGILFPRVALEPAELSLARVQLLMDEQPMHLGNDRVVPKISFGLAAWHPGMSADALLIAADKRLYEAKAVRA